MKYQGLKIIFLLLVFLLPLMGADNFIMTDKWNHGEKIFRDIISSSIDKDGNVLVGFYINGIRLITPGEVIAFAPYGEGPGDVMGWKEFVPYKGDIAIVEWADKTKVFTKKNDTYVYKERLWFKRGPYPFGVTGAAFIDNKWFFTGLANINFHPTISKICYLKVYDANRMPLKVLLKDEYKGKNQKHLMDFYIAGFKDRLYFLPENQLKTSVISIKNLKVINTVELEKPAFYKPMPAEFYSFKRYANVGKEMIADIEHWKTSYNRITKVLTEGNYLVLQLRTCSDELKKFCLLFYNAYSLKLEKTIFIDDFLLGSKNGNYYFYANGNPSLDDDTDNCVINIYQFKQKNEK